MPGLFIRTAARLPPLWKHGWRHKHDTDRDEQSVSPPVGVALTGTPRFLVRSATSGTRAGTRARIGRGAAHKGGLMKPANANRLLLQAAEPALERIRGECGRATGMVRKMLEHLPARLLEPDFDGAQWMRECGVSSSITEIEFHALLCAPPGHYIRDAKMEVAARFLRAVDLSLEEIAERFGYSRGDTFSDAFENWSGLRPIVYRKKIREAVAAIGPPPDEYLSTSFLRKVIHGELEPRQAADLCEHMEKISTLAEGEGRQRRPAPAEAEIERLWAEELWARIRYKAFSEQQFILRQQLCFDTMAPFELLREKSVEEGRLDRRRGVQLAELALVSLDTCAGALGADLPNRKAQGRIALANAYWLGGDHARAQRLFSRAELDLAEAGVHRDPAVEAKLHRHQAEMRRYQRRYDEAMELVERAIPEPRP